MLKGQNNVNKNKDKTEEMSSNPFGLRHFDMTLTFFNRIFISTAEDLVVQ